MYRLFSQRLLCLAVKILQHLLYNCTSRPNEGRMSEAIKAFPGVDPLAVMILFFLIPPIILAITIRLIWKNYHWRGGFFTKLISNFGVVLNHHAPLITCANFFMACLVFLNQGSFVLNNYTTNSDVKYYLRVDRPEFTSYDLIFNAQALNSIRAIRLAAEENSISRRLHDHQEMETFDIELPSNRNLATANTDGAEKILNLIYHRDDWSVVTSDEQLTNICLTERNIRANIPCLTSNYDFTFRSYIPLVFDPTTCEYLKDYEQARSQIGYFPNEQYFSDRTMYSSDDSSIVISYMRMGSCRNVYSNEEFAVALNAQAVGGIQVTHASFSYLADEFRASTGNLKKVMIYSSLFAFLFLMFSVRGVVVALATMFCIALSMINATALLSHYDYAFLSAFNAAALLVLLSVGAGWVHLYGSAWRHTVKRGKNASPVCLTHIFGTVGSGNFLTFLACCLAFFALGAAPLVFMSELGYFVGIAMLMFFFLFHYLIVPLWVWTSWYVIPSRYHNEFRLLRQKYCLMCLTRNSTSAANEMVREHNREEYHNEHRRSRVQHVLGRHGHGDDVEDSEEDDQSDAEGGRSVSTVSAVAAVVPADQVRFATEGETKHDEDGMGTVTARAAMLDEDGNEIHEEGYQEDAVVPVGDTPPAVPPAAQEDEDNATQDGGDDTRWCSWHRFCYSKGPVKILGFVALLITIFLILLSVLLSQQKMDTNFAYLQLIDGPSNLNTVLDVFEFYRGDVFYAVDDDNAARLVDPNMPTRAPTRKPTSKPTVFGNPTPLPTFKPTISPKPTPLPTITPTARPTLAPTGSKNEPVSVYTDFRVTGCWGLHATKDSYDGAAQPNWDYYRFRAYLEDGFVADMTDACDYVDTHRDYLSVHPDWNATTDCLSEQYKIVRSNPAYPVTTPVRDILFIWGTTFPTAPQLIGLYNNETEKKESIQPVWVCANFTGRTDMASFHDDMPYGKELRQRWESVFNQHGNKNAKKHDVNVVVGCVEFTYPLLGQYITSQVQYQAMVFFLGFAGLLLLFTWFDIGMTIFGVMGLFTIYALTIFIGVYRINSVLNLGDVVALIMLLPFLVSFTIHLLTSYISNRHIHDKNEKEERAVQVHTAFLSPALLKTQRYMFKALLGPLGLALVAAAGFTFAKYPVLRRFASYYIICAIVAYLFCVIIQPFLLAFACRQRYCDWYEDDHDHHEYHEPSPSDEPNGQRVITPETRHAQEVELQRHRPRRSLNNLQPHGSQFQMNSVYNNTSQFQMDNEFLAPNIVHTSYTVDNADGVPPPQEPLTYTEDIDYAPIPLPMPGYDDHYNYDPSQVDYGYDAYGNPLPPPLMGAGGRAQVLRPPMVIRHVHRVTSNQPILTVPSASQSFYQPDLSSAAPQSFYQPEPQYYAQDPYHQPVQGGYYQDGGEDYGDDQSYVSGASRSQYNPRSGGSVNGTNAPSFYGNGRASRSQYIAVPGRTNTSQYAGSNPPAAGGYPRGVARQPSPYGGYDQQSQYDDSEYGQPSYAPQGYPQQQQYASPPPYPQQGYPPRQYNNNNQSQYYDQNNY